MESTKELIAKTAFRLFLEKGYKQTSLREIAAECGVTHVNVLYHYKSKNDLGVVLLTRYISALLISTAREAQRLGMEPSIDNFCFFWLAHYSFIEKHRAFAAFFCDLFDSNREGMTDGVLRHSAGTNNMVNSLLGQESSATDVEEELYMSLIVDADEHLVRLLMNGQVDRRWVMRQFVKLSLLMLMDLSMSFSELEEAVNRVFEKEEQIKMVLFDVEKMIY